MVSKITSGFEKASKANRAAYIPFIMGGFPNKGTFVSLLKTLDDGGADIIEVGIPFSDPLADGPTIQKAGQIALEKGANLVNILQTLREEDLPSTCALGSNELLEPDTQDGNREVWQ